MTHRAIPVVALALLACRAEEPSTRTAFVTRVNVANQALAKLCRAVDGAHHLGDSANPETWRSEHEVRCIPKSSFGGGGWLHIRWVYSTTQTSEGNEVCRLQIGPDAIVSPLSKEFVAALFRDPETAAKVRTALDGLSDTDEVDFVTHVDGISVQFSQFNSVDGANVEVILNGCERLPGGITTNYPGNPLLFKPLQMPGVPMP